MLCLVLANLKMFLIILVSVLTLLVALLDDFRVCKICLEDFTEGMVGHVLIRLLGKVGTGEFRRGLKLCIFHWEEILCIYIHLIWLLWWLVVVNHSLLSIDVIRQW